MFVEGGCKLAVVEWTMGSDDRRETNYQARSFADERNTFSLPRRVIAHLPRFFASENL